MMKKFLATVLVLIFIMSFNGPLFALSKERSCRYLTFYVFAVKTKTIVPYDGCSSFAAQSLLPGAGNS